MDDDQKNFFIYPRAGKKWEREEDERLQKAYHEKRAAGFGNFEAFILDLTKQFQRAPGGLKSRLAMHFNDVPGWDYGRDEYRKQELDKKTAEAIPEERNEFLREEYQKYLESKKETWLKFIKRLSAASDGVGVEYLRNRLEHLVGEVVKYGRSDVVQAIGLPTKKLNPPEIPQLDLADNPEMAQALNWMEKTSENLFLTGEAGTGKSTLLQYFRSISKKNLVVLAPTGVAAFNVGGQTIHSFCAFGPDITLQKVKKLNPQSGKKNLLEKLNTVIIDEISMVRADLLDCVDKFLRLNGPNGALPFGGLQMIFIGDLYQLPPVEKDFGAGDGLIKEYASPYFFDARVYKTAKFARIQLKIVYRQKDRVFLDVLSAVRNNAATQDHLTVLNSRSHNDDNKFVFEKFAIYLTTTNARARQINHFFLDKLPVPLKTYQGTATGNFEGRELPTDLELQIKIGAQIMMLNNDREKRWVNGTMGKVLGIESDGHGHGKYSDDYDYDANNIMEDENEKVSWEENFQFQTPDFKSADIVVVELETGETVYVQPHTWEMFKFVLGRRTQTVDSETTGTFTQYPFKSAWAVTIHKAQGKTFDKVFIDLASGTFAHGQLYVALSRCRTLEGLYLKRPVYPQDIILDNRIVEFLNGFGQDPQAPQYVQEMPEQEYSDE